MLQALQWLAAAVGSAIVGALVYRHLNRAIPRVSIEDTAITGSAHDRFPDRVVPIPSDDQTIRGLYESDWTKSIREPSVPLARLAEELRENKERIDQLVQALDRFGGALPDLYRILDRPSHSDRDAGDFFELWELNDGLIHAALVGDYRRGTLSIPQPPPTYEGDPVLRLEQRTATKEGLDVWGCSTRGGKFVSALVPERPSDVPLSNYLARALAYFDQLGLRAMLDTVAGEVEKVAQHERLRDGLALWLVGVSRWSVSLVLDNLGGQALSVSPKAQLTVETDGTTLGRDRVLVELDHRDATRELTPINVPPGESRVARFVSNALVSDVEAWRELYRLYEARACQCYVAVSITPVQWPGASLVESRRRRFGPGSFAIRADRRLVSLLLKK